MTSLIRDSIGQRCQQQHRDAKSLGHSYEILPLWQFAFW